MAKEQTAAFVYGGIAAVLLLCLFDMPYGFYSFVRFAATAAFCYLAFKSYNFGNKDRMFLFIILVPYILLYLVSMNASIYRGSQ